jgi:hypothetical protein
MMCDAEARRGGAATDLKFVATKTADQLDLQALHRVRHIPPPTISDDWATVAALYCFLEF